MGCKMQNRAARRGGNGLVIDINRRAELGADGFGLLGCEEFQGFHCGPESMSRGGGGCEEILRLRRGGEESAD